MSPPTRGRELKYVPPVQHLALQRVAPYAGA